MIQLQLQTVAILDAGCFSVLCYAEVPFAVTVEHTFERSPVISVGKYSCKRSYYIGGSYPTFEIFVAGHTRILFHKGNTELNSRGCICVAESFGELNNMTAVLDSKHGFEEFMDKLDGIDEFELDVRGRG